MTIPLKITAIGDLHFGNPRINSEDLYNNLCKFLYPELEDTHLLLLTGDTYDQLTTVSSNANRCVLRFISDIFRMSNESDMQIRILHGTYSHDRDQVSVCSTLTQPNTRAAVISAITTERLSDFRSYKGPAEGSLQLLYIPDNLPYKKSQDVISHIQKVYTCAGIDEADIILGHGTCSYTLNCAIEHYPPCTYEVSELQELLNDNGIGIFGHIHTPSHRDKIYYCGSFERMVHGEEEKKGFRTFTRQNNKWVNKFIVNQNARPFITITPQGNDVEECINDYMAQVKAKFDLNKPGWVRVVYSEPEFRAIYQRITLQEFPKLIFNGKSIKDADVIQIQLDDISLANDDVKPSPENLGELVYQFLEEKQCVNDIAKSTIIEAVSRLI